MYLFEQRSIGGVSEAQFRAALSKILTGAMVFTALALCALPATAGASAALAANAPSPKNQLPEKIRWHACTGKPANTDCAEVPAPLDGDHPEGPQISLAIARHHASKPNDRIGSLFVNFGGPGVPGVSAVLEAGAELDNLGGGRFDVVGWDPRGTGNSTHIRCFDDEKSMERFWGEDWTIPSTPAGSRRYAKKTVAYIARCEAMSGWLIAHSSTADTVRDLDYLRRLVGDAQLTYRGLSYGTFIGQTYINMFPQSVRAIILDANINPVPYTTSTEAGLRNNGADSDALFEKFLSLCEQAGGANCKLAGEGSVTQRVQALLTRLRRGPIPAPRGPAPYELRYGDLQVVVWSMLGMPQKWPELADELNQAAHGDGSAMANTYHQGTTLYESALLAATPMQCADKPLDPPGTILTYPRVLQRLTARNILGSVEAWWLWAPCASRQVVSPGRYSGPWTATTENPILVIGNRYDSRTQYGNAVTASRRLGNAVLLTLEGYGHPSEADPSACIDDAVTQYLVNITVPPNGTICHPDRAPFDPNFGKELVREQPID